MLVHIPGALAREEVASFREAMDAEAREAAGAGASADGEAASRALGARLLSVLAANRAFVSAAFPLRISPPRFGRHGEGDCIDPGFVDAILDDPSTGARIRADLAATLFLSEPEEYEGGELIVDDIYGSRQFKPPAGNLILYSAGSLHMVASVTRGERIAAFLWLQSMIKGEEARDLVCNLDAAI